MYDDGTDAVETDEHAEGHGDDDNGDKDEGDEVGADDDNDEGRKMKTKRSRLVDSRRRKQQVSTQYCIPACLASDKSLLPSDGSRAKQHSRFPTSAHCQSMLRASEAIGVR